MNHRMKGRVELGEPVVVSQAPETVRAWGPWQFPVLHRLPDGRLCVEFHKEADSILAYGLPKGYAVSGDGGVTWQETPPMDIGLQLAGGDRLAPYLKKSEEIPSSAIQGEPVSENRSSYGPLQAYYRVKDLPKAHQVFYFKRQKRGETEWKEEQAFIEIPDALKMRQSGHLPHSAFWRMREAPDGSIWGIHYQHARTADQAPVHFHCLFFRSTDEGRTWEYRSTIAYEPDPQADEKSLLRDGFTEPDVCFLPDGSLYALFRTTDGHGIGPLYESRSLDNGKTWSRPAVFDSLGVWPNLLHLPESGITLAVYGRPGLFLRYSQDPECRVWSGRETVMLSGPQEGINQDTCAYAGLIALNDNQALLVYSDFQYPRADGVPCKTILARKITIT
ncbi:sialidase family protein [Paenibacillus aurantius]|uniref:Sialidase family protein n=1 Tax=Paenibacillus aurantius TaxID=2918900 RepID=A0AA96RH79_9BACL|nr:sialidase family protein [Paenibacillus aurantius]WNQ13271.1 sialidase family protein [Paenibacillus aurantius]